MENNEQNSDNDMWSSFYGSREASEEERLQEEDNSPNNYGVTDWNRQGIATAAMILGIISIAFLGAGIVPGIIAIIFGIISLKGQGRKMAIAGIVTGSIGAVLAICILLLYVFIPILQASQRDTARKNDVSVISTRIVSLQSNNNGNLPSVSEISASGLSLIGLITSSGQPTTEKAVFAAGVNCDGQWMGGRHYSISIRLENGSVYCQDL